MSRLAPTRKTRRTRVKDRMLAWDEVFPHLPARLGTEDLQQQHRALWERIRKKGGEMTQEEEQELNRLFLAIYPQLLQGKWKTGFEDLETELEDDNDPLNDVVVPKTSEKQQHKKEKRMFEDWHKNLNKYHKKLGSSPLINFFLGALSLLLWASASVVQIQTSEYLAMGNNTRVAAVAWSVLTQPWLLVSGQAPIEVVTSWTYAWVVELITLVFALALTVAIHKIATVNPHLAKWFVIGGGALILLNSWADYSSSPGSNPLVQLLIAVAIGGIVVVGLPLGIGLIEKGFEEL